MTNHWNAIRWVHEAAELGAHRLGHAIALGVNPDKYGVHRRHETASERSDQLKYDLRHADGLGQSGVPVDSSRITQELDHLAGLPKDHQLTMEYDEHRLDGLRDRQKYAIQSIRALGSVIEVVPHVEPPDRWHRPGRPSPLDPIRR